MHQRHQGQLLHKLRCERLLKYNEQGSSTFACKNKSQKKAFSILEYMPSVREWKHSQRQWCTSWQPSVKFLRSHYRFTTDRKILSLVKFCDLIQDQIFKKIIFHFPTKNNLHIFYAGDVNVADNAENNFFFRRNIIPHFLNKKWHHIFIKKKYHFCRSYMKCHICMYFFGTIIRNFTTKKEYQIFLKKKYHLCR